MTQPLTTSTGRNQSTLPGIFLGLLGIAVLVIIIFYRGTLGFTTWRDLSHRFFPCQIPMTYSVEHFDQRFDVTEPQFLDAIETAENLWEAEVNKNLFEHRTKGELSVNLIYDYRQAGTDRLNALDLKIETNNASYNALKAEYDTTYATYLAEKAELDKLTADHEAHVQSYDVKVNELNAQGGVTPKQARELQTERQQLNAETSTINAKIKTINATADDVNALADALNNLANKLNLTADRYNKIGDTLGDEFVEGTFGASAHGGEINIYQFENQDKLVRVLAHELGHALGLDHVDDPEAIMYRLNEGEKLAPSDTDIQALKALCRMD